MKIKTALGGLAAAGLVGSGVLMGSVVGTAFAQTPPATQTAPAAAQTPGATQPGPNGSNPGGWGKHGGFGPGGFGPGGFGPGGAAGTRDANLALAAQTIGITQADLQTALKGGQTIAQVAQAHNVSAQKVIDALVKDATAKLQARPNWAQMTAAQQAQETTALQQRITQVVNNGAPQKGPGGPARGDAGNELALAAQTIGISQTDLQTALKGGQTIAQVAQAHNVSAQKVIDALVKDATAKLQARPNWAQMTAAQQAQETTALQQRITQLVNNGFPQKGPGGHERGGFGNDLALAAQTIGISQADLQTALKGGQTVAQVAQAHNVSAQKVIDALVKDATAKLQARPNWAQMTAAQQAQETANLQARITAWVNGTAGKPGTHF